jgi:hypothetical protein
MRPIGRHRRDRDREVQGDPETVVLLPSGESLIGLYILGVGRQIMLGIREDREGRPLSCAVVNNLCIDTSRVQSNPRRWADEKG